MPTRLCNSGVRPSSGAASAVREPVPEHLTVLGTFYIAAPEDGRTPSIIL